jgi:hypothetical protein
VPAAGAVPQQRRHSGGWRPLGFFSRKLSAAEAHYSAFDRELLAVHSSIQHFRHWLEGRHFTVYTDHKGYFQVPVAEKDIKKTGGASMGSGI